MTRTDILASVFSAGLLTAVLVATLWPHPLVGANDLGGDKVQHALGFGSLVAPAALLRPHWLKWQVPLAVLLGGLVELIQGQIGRDADVRDWIADTVGVFVMLILCRAAVYAVIRLRRRYAPFGEEA